PADEVEVVLVLDSLVEGIDELLPGAAARGQRPQLLVDLIARDVLVPGARERLEGEPRIAAAALVELGDLAEHGHALRGILDVSELGVEDDDQLLPPVALAIDG